ncbi:MAG: hypothetical protein LBI68_01640 [Azoarcus sp.]|jgi:hypothetical protein|nr:hypothetical protein [Azoarcus sp.]
MKRRISFVLAIAAIILGGCATPQQALELAGEALTPQSGKVGIAMAQIPKADTYFPGASCLLCFGAAALANSKLTAHTQTLSNEDLPKLKNEIASLLSEQGVQTQVIEEVIDVSALPSFSSKEANIARKNFDAFRTKYSIDKLIVIAITGHGFVRSYSAYIPTSDPKGVLNGIGYMVDLASNRYEWYQPVLIFKSADGEWDEPPQFPGLTNAYFQAVETGKDILLKPFVGKAPQ